MKGWLTVDFLLVLAVLGCNTNQARPVASRQIARSADQPQNPVAAVSLSPAEISYGTEPSVNPASTTETTSVTTSTRVRRISVYVPERWQEETIAAFSLPSLIDGAWDWQLVNTTSEADIVMVEGPGNIGAGDRPIALIIPFTSPIEEVTAEEATQYLSDPSSGILVVDWDEIPTGFKALRVGGLLPNDDDYTLRKTWSLISITEYEMSAITLGSALSEQLSRHKSIHLAAVGDIMLDRSLGIAIYSGDLQYPFAKVANTLSRADFTVGNLESSLGNTGEPVLKSYNFQAPPEAAQSLALAGFDIMSLANNHAMDFGSQALIQAIDLLEENEILSVGVGANSAVAREPVIVEKNGVRIAFLAYVDVPVEISGFDTRTWEASVNSPGLAWASPETIIQDVSSAKASSEVVVVILHSGYEFVQQPSPPQIASAQAAIDAGASLVIGHHSHLLQGVAFYKEGVIVYGLGNFAFDMDGSRDSVILNVWLDSEGVHNIEIVPVTVAQGGQPDYATPGDSRRIREELYTLTRLLNQP